MKSAKRTMRACAFLRTPRTMCTTRVKGRVMLARFECVYS
jgi:hypothetical protein